MSKSMETTEWIKEESAIENYEWLVDSRLGKNDEILAITTGTDDEGEKVFLVCSSESGSLTPPEEREYGVISACYSKHEAQEKLESLLQGQSVESNIISD